LYRENDSYCDDICGHCDWCNNFYLTGMDIAGLFMLIWDFVSSIGDIVRSIIDLIDWLKKVLNQ